MKLEEILQIGESPLARQFRHVVGIVDRLHRFPDLPAIPVVLTKSRREGGAYNHRVRPSRAISIAVSIYAEYPSLTLLHEVGHLLDHLALNPIKRTFASEHDPMFDPLRDFWNRSQLVRKMVAQLARGKHLPSFSRGMIRYHLQTPEMWARTYTQWAAVKSDDMLLQACMTSVMGKPEPFAGQMSHFFWEKDEQAAIIQLVDRLFSEARML